MGKVAIVTDSNSGITQEEIRNPYSSDAILY